MGPLNFWITFFCDWLVPEVERWNYLSVMVQKSGGWWIMRNFHCPIFVCKWVFCWRSRFHLAGCCLGKAETLPGLRSPGESYEGGRQQNSLHPHTHLVLCIQHPWMQHDIIVLVLQTRVLMNGWEEKMVKHYFLWSEHRFSHIEAQKQQLDVGICWFCCFGFKSKIYYYTVKNSSAANNFSPPMKKVFQWNKFYSN